VNLDGLFVQWVHGYLLAAGSLAAVTSSLVLFQIAPPWLLATPWLIGVCVMVLFVLGCFPSILWQQSQAITGGANGS